MDWNDIIDGERERLKRIVAWMLAFALLAERAALASPQVRRHVMQYLCMGEAVVLDYLSELAEEAGSQPEFSESLFLLDTGSSSADALRLAGSFRALAALISAILHSVPEYIHPRTHPIRPVRALFWLSIKPHRFCAPQKLGALPLGFFDTS